MIWREEEKNDHCQTLMSINEISIVTGSYKSDEEYVTEISDLVRGIKNKIRPDLRVVVGSHEGKTEDTFRKLKKAGVTVFAFPIESIDENIRQSQMNNRKGRIPMTEVLQSIEDGIKVLGPDGVIIRLVAGMGDKLDDTFEKTIKKIAASSEKSPFFNINQYMAFTHFHSRLFQTNRPYDLDYMLKFCSIINNYVPEDRQIKFKVSP